MADSARSRAKLLLDAAQLIENSAESLKTCSTIRRLRRGKSAQMIWDTPGDRRAYERETRIAKRLRGLANG